MGARNPIYGGKRSKWLAALPVATSYLAINSAGQVTTLPQAGMLNGGFQFTSPVAAPAGSYLLQSDTDGNITYLNPSSLGNLSGSLGSTANVVPKTLNTDGVTLTPSLLSITNTTGIAALKGTTPEFCLKDATNTYTIGRFRADALGQVFIADGGSGIIAHTDTALTVRTPSDSMHSSIYGLMIRSYSPLTPPTGFVATPKFIELSHDEVDGHIYSSYGKLRLTAASHEFRNTADSAYAAAYGGTYRAYAPLGVKYAQLSHDDTNAILTTPSGDINLQTPAVGSSIKLYARDITYTFNDGIGVGFQCPAQFVLSGTGRLGSAVAFGWSSNTTPTGAANDTQFTRNAAGLVNINHVSGSKYLTLGHDNTNAILSSSSGDIKLEPAGGIVYVGVTGAGTGSTQIRKNRIDMYDASDNLTLQFLGGSVGAIYTPLRLGTAGGYVGLVGGSGFLKVQADFSDTTPARVHAGDVRAYAPLGVKYAQLSHDDTGANLTSSSGGMYIYESGSNTYLMVDSLKSQFAYNGTAIYAANSGGLSLQYQSGVGWSSGAPGTNDVNIARNAAGLIDVNYVGGAKLTLGHNNTNAILTPSTGSIVLGLGAADGNGLMFGGATSSDPMLRKNSAFAGLPHLALYGATLGSWGALSVGLLRSGPDNIQWATAGTSRWNSLNAGSTAYLPIAASSLLMAGASGTTLDFSIERTGTNAGKIGDGSTGYGDLTLRTTIRPFVAPAQITADQNNYAPTRGGKYRLSTDASRNITGLSISQVNGDEIRVYNVGSFNIVLKHEDSASTAANRFTSTTGADITLAPNEGASLDYDGTATRWWLSKL